MKIECSRSALLSACQLVGVAVPSKSSAPILTNVKAVAEGDQLTLMATDREIGIRTLVSRVTIASDGSAIFPFNRLVSILREATTDLITIEADAYRMTVQAGSSEYEMVTEDPNMFPDIPGFDSQNYHEVPSPSLRDMIGKTAFAASKEATKYAMNSVLWEFAEGKLTLVATDSRRLAMTECTVAKVGDEPMPIKQPLVPTKAMQLLAKNLEDDGLLKVCFGRGDVLFQTDRSTIYARLVEGRFPPYLDIFPRGKTQVIRLPIGETVGALKQSSIMTEEESKRVNMQFLSGRLTLTAQGVTRGRAKVEMPIEYDEKELTIILDPAYIIEMLGKLEGLETIDMHVRSPELPIVFRGGGYVYLQMPLSFPAAESPADHGIIA